MFFFPPWKYPSDAVALIYKVEYTNMTSKWYKGKSIQYCSIVDNIRKSIE
jgi:hypothetical protein